MTSSYEGSNSQLCNKAKKKKTAVKRKADAEPRLNISQVSLIFLFQWLVHCATKTAEGNFDGHVFIIPVVKKKFGLFRTMKSFNFV